MTKTGELIQMKLQDFLGKEALMIFKTCLWLYPIAKSTSTKKQ